MVAPENGAPKTLHTRTMVTSRPGRGKEVPAGAAWPDSSFALADHTDAGAGGGGGGGGVEGEVEYPSGVSGGVDPIVADSLASGKSVRYKLQVVYLPPRGERGGDVDSEASGGSGGLARKGGKAPKPVPREVPESVWGSVLLPADTTVRAIRALLQQNRAAFGFPLTHSDGVAPTTVWVYSDTHSASRLRDDCVLADRLVRKAGASGGGATAVLYVLPPALPA